MKFVVFSDIHGNDRSLKKMLQDIQKLDIAGYIFCGDIMGYFHNQEYVLKYLVQLPNLIAVRGNHDDYYLKSRINHADIGLLVSRYGKSYKTELSTDSLNFLKSLPLSLDCILDGKRMFIAHGSYSNWLEGRLYPDMNISLNSIYDCIILGHTHYQMIKSDGNTLIINPGSLGQPRDGKGFSYIIMDTKTMQVQFKNVQVSVNDLIMDLKHHGESYQLIDYIKSTFERQ